jgi:hypothetical protein
MNAINMTVNYKSGETVVQGRVGKVEQQRPRRNGTFEYFVRWGNGESGWYLASNLQF